MWITDLSKWHFCPDYWSKEHLHLCIVNENHRIIRLNNFTNVDIKIITMRNYTIEKLLDDTFHYLKIGVSSSLLYLTHIVLFGTKLKKGH